MRIKGFLRVVSLLLVLCFLGFGLLKVDWGVLAGRAVCFSVAATAPDGLFGFFNPKPTVGDNKPPQYEDVKVEVDNLADGTISEGSGQSVTVEVKETVIGSIIKKTLSPYNAKLKADKVYINNTSGAEVDIKSMLASPLDFKVTESSEPQILIYHTHATEAFMDDESQYLTDFDEPRSTDTDENIVKIGAVIAEKLKNAGFAVVHDKTLHDHPGFSGSYTRSAETVKAALKKYPSIKIAIDVHRDSISSGKSDKVAPVVSVNGREAAQVMLVMGSQTGSIENHPDWHKNLQLATKLQYVFENSYPQFARAMLLRSAKYNQNLTTGSFLIEVGSDANTFEQALYSAELVGDSLITLLKSK